MYTVTGISIEQQGSGYTDANAINCVNLEHGDINTLYVDITTNSAGEVITATPTEAKTGLNFEIDDLVYINAGDLKCILKITSVQGP